METRNGWLRRCAAYAFDDIPSDVLGAIFCVLAACLLGMTWVWRVPMMLWDHLDFVPIYEAWQHGVLVDSALLRIHGGHMHTAAYVVLLATTALSGGQTWLDCLASWLLLLVFAAIVRSFARDTFNPHTRDGLFLSMLVTFLSLYPGHLANLQWGWQVAVFLSLAGVGVTLFALTRATLTWRRQLIALAGAAIAYFSFATSIAAIPVAIALIVLRKDCPFRRRLIFTCPWVIAAVLVAGEYRSSPAGDASLDIVAIARYTLNFLGGGIARFATDVAPWVAVAGVVTGVCMYVRCLHRRDALPWLGLMLFASIGGVLTAFGRVAAFGSQHAFAARYVSFSSLFWLGWVGMAGCAWKERLPPIARISVAIVALLAVVNGVHMIGKAAHVGARTRDIARTIRATYPNVDAAVLADIYFDQPTIALQRLDTLYLLGFPPFDCDDSGSRLYVCPPLIRWRSAPGEVVRCPTALAIGHACEPWLLPMPPTLIPGH